jgi:hypothetical protein
MNSFTGIIIIFNWLLVIISFTLLVAGLTEYSFKLMKYSALFLGGQVIGGMMG